MPSRPFRRYHGPQIQLRRQRDRNNLDRQIRMHLGRGDMRARQTHQDSHGHGELGSHIAHRSSLNHIGIGRLLGESIRQAKESRRWCDLHQRPFSSARRELWVERQ